MLGMIARARMIAVVVVAGLLSLSRILAAEGRLDLAFARFVSDGSPIRSLTALSNQRLVILDASSRLFVLGSDGQQAAPFGPDPSIRSIHRVAKDSANRLVCTGVRGLNGRDKFVFRMLADGGLDGQFVDDHNWQPIGQVEVTAIAVETVEKVRGLAIPARRAKD